MYEAKKLGRNQYHFFSEKLNSKVQEGIALNKDMKQALVDKECKKREHLNTDSENT